MCASPFQLLYNNSRLVTSFCRPAGVAVAMSVSYCDSSRCVPSDRPLTWWSWYLTRKNVDRQSTVLSILIEDQKIRKSEIDGLVPNDVAHPNSLPAIHTSIHLIVHRTRPIGTRIRLIVHQLFIVVATHLARFGIRQQQGAAQQQQRRKPPRRLTSYEPSFYHWLWLWLQHSNIPITLVPFATFHLHRST
jgi:hypothetical protein